jgi:hypothetical protein
VFKKQKTGPLAYNVSYSLNVLRCKQRALNEEELEIIANAKPIDELVPRLTPEEQKDFLDSLDSSNAPAPAEVTAAIATEEVDDIPY